MIEVGWEITGVLASAQSIGYACTVKETKCEK